MPSPRFELLRSRDLRAALTALGDIAEAADASFPDERGAGLLSSVGVRWRTHFRVGW